MEDNLLAQYIPPEGVSIDSSGNATDPAQQKILDRQREKEEEEKGTSPLAMGLLQLGASMMRDEGWKDRPITLGESLGKAIPRGISGYYNQDAINREDALLQSQQQTLDDTAETARLQGISDQDKKVQQFKAFSRNVDSIPDAAFSVGGGEQAAANRRENLKQMWLSNPEGAMKALEKIYETQAAIGNRVAPAKSYTEQRSERESEILEGRRPKIQKQIMELMQMDDVPESEKQKIQTLYGDVGSLTEDNLKSFRTDYATAMAAKKPKDFTAERKRTFEFLKEKARWEKFTPREQDLIEFMEQEADPKKALDNINKFMNERKYEGDFKIIDSKTYTRNGREVKVETKRNFITGEEITVETDGMKVTHTESMTGAKINERFPDYFPKIDFDPNKIYNLNIVNGKPFMTGAIFDMAKKDPGKATKMAKDMRVQAVSMKMITEEDSKLLMAMPPEAQVAAINKLLLDGKTSEPNYAGVIRSGVELNKLAKEAGKKEYAVENENYFWNGKRWEGLKEGSAQDKFGNEKDLRKEYDINTKKYKDSLFAYNSIRQGFFNANKDPGAAGISDIMIVRAFLLMIEPNSVVRESEFASAARAQGLVEYSNSLLDKMAAGAILTKDSRQRFMNAATAYMTAVQDAHQMQRTRYTKIAEDYDLSPGRIIDDPFANMPELDDFVPYTMTDQDRKDLRDIHLVPPPAKGGGLVRRSGNPKLGL